MPLESYYVLSPKFYIVVIGMNTQRESTRRAKEGIANVGAHDNQSPPQDNQGPPLEEVDMGDQVPVVPPLMTEGEIRETFLNLSQAMTYQANSVTSHVQIITTQVNREIGPLVPQHARTMASHLREFNKMNPPMFFCSRSDEDP